MANPTDGESRLRQFAQGFRREANPRPDLATSLMAGLGERPRESRFAMLPAVAMAASVLVAGLGLAFGAMQLRSLGHPSPTPPVSVITPTASPSSSPTASPSPSPTPAGAVPGAIPALASIQMVGPHLGWAVGSHAHLTTTDGSHNEQMQDLIKRLLAEIGEDPARE